MLVRKKKKNELNGYSSLHIETVNLSDLRPHPRNYKSHPDDQLAHIIQSIKDHGFYRNVVIARDGTILAGHGVVLAAERMEWKEIQVCRLNISPDDPRALKLLAGDNEIAGRAEVDDRLLSEILKEIKDVDTSGLLGTGYDDMMLANLVFVTRPEHEIASFDAAAAWVGMPEYQQEEPELKLILNFRTKKDMQKCIKLLGSDVNPDNTRGKLKSIWWPQKKERNDLKSVRFDQSKNA